MGGCRSPGWREARNPGLRHIATPTAPSRVSACGLYPGSSRAITSARTTSCVSTMSMGGCRSPGWREARNPGLRHIATPTAPSRVSACGLYPRCSRAITSARTTSCVSTMSMGGCRSPGWREARNPGLRHIATPTAPSRVSACGLYPGYNSVNSRCIGRASQFNTSEKSARSWCRQIRTGCPVRGARTGRADCCNPGGVRVPRGIRA
jgi:hypothetical protein